MNLYEKYIIACANFYGVISHSKLKSIYHNQNNQNDFSYDQQILKENFIHVSGDYFKHEIYTSKNAFHKLLVDTKFKPYYIPEKEILLNYVKDGYFESNQSFDQFLVYLKKNKHNLIIDYKDAAMEIRDYLFFGDSFEDVMDEARHIGVNIENDNIYLKMMNYLINIYRHMRTRENRGFTYGEIKKHFEVTEPDLYNNKEYIDLGFEAYDLIANDVKDIADSLVFKLLNQVLEKYLYKIKHIPPKVLLIALTKIAMIINENTNDELINQLLSKFHLQIQNEKLEAFTYYIYHQAIYHTINDYTVERYDILMDYFKNNEVFNLKLMHKKYYNRLKKIQGTSLINPQLDKDITELISYMFTMSLDYRIYLYNLIELYPLSYVGLSCLHELISDESEEEEMEVLSLVINAFEFVNDQYLKGKHTDFSKNLDNHYYLLALDRLSQIYKINQEYDKSIEIYQKMMKYDLDNMFLANEKILAAYLYSNKIMLFSRSVTKLPDESFYKHFINLFFNDANDLEDQENFDRLYKMVPNLLSHIAYNTKFSTKLNRHERAFYDDYYRFFSEKQDFINLLRNLIQQKLKK